MNHTYDYRAFTNKLAEAIATLSDGRPLIESNSAGDQLSYPFCTYTITSPYIAIMDDVIETEPFEVVISFTWHGTSGLDVLNLANRTNKWFRSFEGREFLRQSHIVVVSVTNAGQRDTFLSIDYERMAGLDIKLRVTDSYIDEVEGIENVEIKNQEDDET